ncbi:putative ankyrin repeat protein RF_0381 [Aspergillus udagawae]|uniref:Ankyrin repeat protein RF_0381 n=1 Tax=Aspergillus udagawae TaxID=91492 RepID=A0ABQ1B509_9EURO|nr:putative ankyrin repeat protein RF_0381 [Aspergillus udagawae]GFF48825.1 putative ankyrin repeat protein RF_0381 [Aspergillus udagawae]GFF93864.1 putative ankyrin repeat protein RF_0381 [Aspergillus udagawae]GFG19970.1 putative ankyrin repeat protein RF_0381 [Aspergillus udagawae]
MAAYRPCALPLELIVMVADYLGPLDLLNLIQGIPHLAPLLNSQHIQAQDDNGRTILHHIVEQGLENLLKPLTKWIPHSSVPDNGGWTLLHQAVRNGDERMTKALVYAGLDISAKDNGGRTALHFACDVDEVGIAQFLLDHGANPSAADYNGRTLLPNTDRRCSVIHERLWRAGAVFRSQPMPRPMPRGLTPLFYAAWLGREDTTRILLEAGADPSIQTEGGETVLQRAISGNHINIVRLLLDAGVDVNAQESLHGHTDLLKAAHWGADDSLRLLLKAGADASAVGYDGRNALHLAATMGHESTVKLLLKEGVDSSAQDNQGYTPLDWAVASENKGVIQILEHAHKNPFLRLVHQMCGECYSKTKSEND